MTGFTNVKTYVLLLIYIVLLGPLCKCKTQDIRIRYITYSMFIRIMGKNTSQLYYILIEYTNRSLLIIIVSLSNSLCTSLRNIDYDLCVFGTHQSIRQYHHIIPLFVLRNCNNEITPLPLRKVLCLHNTNPFNITICFFYSFLYE